MGQWKRTLRNTGISLTVAGVGVMGAAGAASAHGVGPQFVRGTVTTVGTGTITITTHKGTMETIDTSTTTYSETGTLVAPTGVTDGQDVLVKLDPADSTPTAVEITVILDRESGKVTAFTGTSITLAGPWAKNTRCGGFFARHALLRRTDDRHRGDRGRVCDRLRHLGHDDDAARARRPVRRHRLDDRVPSAGARESRRPERCRSRAMTRRPRRGGPTPPPRRLQSSRPRARRPSSLLLRSPTAPTRRRPALPEPRAGARVALASQAARELAATASPEGPEDRVATAAAANQPGGSRRRLLRRLPPGRPGSATTAP